jgi:two-component system nitrate/nitrite response regulator NarL
VLRDDAGGVHGIAGGLVVSKVLVVDDHALFSLAVTVALSADDREVDTLDVTRLTRPAGVVDEVLREPPDIVLLDLDLGPSGDGREAIQPLTRAGVAVVVVTADLDPADWGRCLRLGARAVLTKDRPLEELADVVAGLEAGQSVLDAAEYQQLVSLDQQQSERDEQDLHRLASLSPREREILAALMDGHTVPEIADRDSVSVATLRTQMRSILQKLRVSNQIAAVGLAHRVHWTPPRDARPSSHAAPGGPQGLGRRDG